VNQQGTVNPDEYLVFKPLLGEKNPTTGEKLQPIIGRHLGEKAKKMIYSKDPVLPNFRLALGFLLGWPQGTGFPQLPSVVTSTVDHPTFKISFYVGVLLATATAKATLLLEIISRHLRIVISPLIQVV
jgi:hypothetical protein